MRHDQLFICSRASCHYKGRNVQNQAPVALLLYGVLGREGFSLCLFAGRLQVSAKGGDLDSSLISLHSFPSAAWLHLDSMV